VSIGLVCSDSIIATRERNNRFNKTRKLDDV
jgi:hypothetical protein